MQNTSPMNTISARYGIVATGLLLVCIVVWWPLVTFDRSPEQFEIHFLAVGQGDATLLRTPEGHEVLIDGGPTGAVVREVAAAQTFGDRHLDLIVATHVDTDHVGGLPNVLKRYDTSILLGSDARSTAPAAEAFLVGYENEPALRVPATAGQVIQLDADTTIHVLAPAGDTTNWRPNAASAVLLVRYGETAVLLTGDAPKGVEEYLARTYGEQLNVDILKLGHHGSDTSTSQALLEVTTPEYAIVSAGLNNRYGHPHPDVIDRTERVGATIYELATEGTVSFVSDGTNFYIDK
jgi:competence protein ComEC